MSWMGLQPQGSGRGMSPWRLTHGLLGHTLTMKSPMSEVRGDLCQFCFTYFLKGHLLSIFLSSLFAGAN